MFTRAIQSRSLSHGVSIAALLLLTGCLGLSGGHAVGGSPHGLETLEPTQPVWQASASTVEPPAAPIAVAPYRVAVAPPLRLGSSAPGVSLLGGVSHGLQRAGSSEVWSEPEAREIAAWADTLRARGVVRDVQLLPSVPLLADEPPSAQEWLAHVRAQAARAGADTLLVLQDTTRQSARQNPLGILDLTLIGAYVVPSCERRVDTVIEGALLDVSNQFVLATQRGDCTRKKRTPSMVYDEQTELDRSRVAALRELGLNLAQVATHQTAPR